MGGVCISMYNSEVLGVLKEEDMPMVLVFLLLFFYLLTFNIRNAP